MSRIKGVNTKPEIIVRKICFGLGYRYRLYYAKLPGKPDLVFPKHKKIIFVHGCFWHWHNCNSGKNRPEKNKEYWIKKLDGNIERDKKNIMQLKDMGWKITIIWECETKKTNREKLVKKIQKYLCD